MRSRIFIFILTLVCCASCHRDPDGLGDPGAAAPSQTILLTRGQKSTRRPRTPDRQKIEVTYVGHELTIHFSIPDGLCSLSLCEAETGYTQFFIIDSDGGSATVDVLLHGKILVELVTSSGKIYEGELDINRATSPAKQSL